MPCPEERTGRPPLRCQRSRQGHRPDADHAAAFERQVALVAEARLEDARARGDGLELAVAVGEARVVVAARVLAAAGPASRSADAGLQQRWCAAHARVRAGHARQRHANGLDEVGPGSRCRIALREYGRSMTRLGGVVPGCRPRRAGAATRSWSARTRACPDLHALDVTE